MRSEDIRLDAAIEELLRIGEEACLPVQISHFKIALRSRWGEAKALLRRLDAARARGVDVSADVYPYEAWQSTLRVLFPERDYADRRAAEFALEHLAAPEDLKLSEFEPEPALVGKTVAEIARQRGTDPATTLMDLIRQAQSFGSHGGKEMVIGRSMSEADIAQILAWPHTNVSSDGLLVDEHPRGAGSFTKVLRVFVREKRLLTIEEAVHKMTALSAAHVGITDRGVIREGAFADLVLFDPDRVADRSTEEEPGKLSVGVERVWVNGRTVWTSQGTTSEFAGRVLRRPPDAAPFKCARAGHRD
jgi:N-acyl-D-amino-acid deacylase